MRITQKFKSEMYTVLDKFDIMDKHLRSEACEGGNWNDEVGYSYLAYADNIRRLLERLNESCARLEKIEDELEYSYEDDAAQLDWLKAAVAANAQN